MAKKYRVTLTPEERAELEAMISQGKADARKLAHARILLQADEADGGPGLDRRRRSPRRWTPARRRSSGCGERFVEEGTGGGPAAQADQADLRPRAGRAPGGPPDRPGLLGRRPTGKQRWTLRLLADRMVELEHAEAGCRTRRCGGRSKKRAQAAPEGDVVHPAEAVGRVRRGTWRTCWRSTTGRTTRGGRWCAWTRRASSWSARSASRCRRRPGRRRAVRQRVRAERGGEPVPGVRAAGRVAARRGDRRRGRRRDWACVRAGPGRRAVQGRGAGRAGDGPAEHALGRRACTRRSRRPRPSGSPTGWRSTTRPSTGVG